MKLRYGFSGIEQAAVPLHSRQLLLECDHHMRRRLREASSGWGTRLRMMSRMYMTACSFLPSGPLSAITPSAFSHMASDGTDGGFKSALRSSRRDNASQSEAISHSPQAHAQATARQRTRCLLRRARRGAALDQLQQTMSL
eukprot:SM000002S05516  [mRNA]  locus=s2:294349:294853:- [translate_table: standard]